MVVGLSSRNRGITFRRILYYFHSGRFGNQDDEQIIFRPKWQATIFRSEHLFFMGIGKDAGGSLRVIKVLPSKFPNIVYDPETCSFQKC